MVKQYWHFEKCHSFFGATISFWVYENISWMTNPGINTHFVWRDINSISQICTKHSNSYMKSKEGGGRQRACTNFWFYNLGFTYSSNKIRKTQIEYLILVYQNFDMSVVMNLKPISLVFESLSFFILNLLMFVKSSSDG